MSNNFPLEIPLPFWYSPMTPGPVNNDRTTANTQPPREPTFDELKAQLKKAVESYHQHPMFHGAVLSGVMLVAQYQLRCPGSTLITPANLLEAAREVAKELNLIAVTANATS